MKKKFLAAACVALSMIGFSSFAQDTNTCTASQQQCTTNTTCQTKGQGKQLKGKLNKERKQANLFEGITLTEAQQTQLQALQSKREAARAERAAARKEAKDGQKAERQKLTAEQRQANDSLRAANRKASQKEYLEEVKAIIGPDNYVVFLENIVVNGPQGGQGKAMSRQGQRPGKAQAAGARGQKGDKARAHKANKQGGKQLRNGAKKAVESATSTVTNS